MAEPQEKSAYQKYREEREAARKAAQGQLPVAPGPYSEYKSKRAQERSGAPTKPVTVLGSTIPGAQTTAPASVMGSPIPRLSEEELQRRRLLDQAQAAAARQADEERKARIKPVQQAADEAAQAAERQYRETAQFPDRTDLMAIKDAARQQVYNEAGVVSPSDAFTGQSANALALGIPAIANKDFRGFLAQAQGDQPLSSLGGQAVGFLAPAAAGWSATARGVNALARPFIPRGADTGSRLARYAPPIAGQTVGAATTNAAYQAGVVEPIRAEQAGEELTLGGMGRAAATGFTDPLNLSPAVLSGVNRTWNTLTSGIAAPSARAADMANRFGVGPRQTAASQGIAQTTQQLGGQLQGADIRGLTNIENALRFALRNNPDIPDVDARIATGFQRIRQSLPLEDDPTLNLARLIEREFSEDAPQTRDVIRNFLRGVGLLSPGGAQIVSSAANRMRGQQTDVLRTELESSFGAQPKTEAQAALQQSLDEFSAAYNTIMPNAPRTGPQAEEALDMLVGSRTNQLPPETSLQSILYRRAQEQNMTVDNYILQNPLEALHWVQSSLAEKARALRTAGTPDTSLEAVVRNMQQPLRQAIPEYGELQGLYRQYTQALGRLGYTRGAEAGVQAELTNVPGFGEKIFGPGGVSKSEEGTQKAADLFLQMDELSQSAAGLSVRDVINDELRKSKAAGLTQRYESAANIRKVATEGGLDALRRVFGETGDRIARRIEQFIDANEFAASIDPEFNSATMNKAQAMATGAQPFAGPLGQATQGAANSMTQNAAGDVFMMASGVTSAPVLSAMRAVPWLANRLQPTPNAQRNIARTLLRRGEIGSQAPAPPQGPAPITPFNPANLPGRAAPTVGVPPAGAAPPPAGAPPIPPATPTRTVGAAPAAAPNAFASGQPAGPGTAQQGFGNAFAESALGSAGGSALGSRTDLNGDGVIDEQDMLIGAAGGTVGVPAVTGAMRRGGTVGVPRGRSMGLGGNTPTTPQQAMRAELPGSPEYEAAKAKGLDMSQAGRMARAKEMGFDTDNVAYRGLTREYDPAKAGRYQMFTSSPEDAGEYAGNGLYNGGNIVAAYLKKGNNLKIEGGRNNFNSIPIRNIPDSVSKFLHPSTRAAGMARTDEIAEAAQKAGYDSVSIKNVFDNAQNEIPLKPRSSSKNEISRRFNELLDDDELLAELEAGGFNFDEAAKFAPEIAPNIPRNYDPVTVDVIFDPSNIRSVNAAFDPDNAASPQLLAGFGKDLLTAGAAGATIGGAMIARDEMLDQPRDNALAVPEPSPAPINPNMPRNAIARTYGAPQAPLDQQNPDDPRNFGVESFEDLRPNDPLRDPWFRREMIKRSLRDQAYQRAQGESRTVGKPKEKRTVGKAGAN
jgi:hypothetical protein